MRRTAALFLLAAGAAARAGGGESEAEILAAWPSAGPHERRRLAARLEELDRARRFVEARPVMVESGGRARTLAETYAQLLRPVLEREPKPMDESDGAVIVFWPGGEPSGPSPVSDAVEALDALAAAYEPPAPAGRGALNLFLAYAADVLEADGLSADERADLLVGTLRVVRGLEERTAADARTRWLVGERIVPAFVAFARRARVEEGLPAKISEAAALLYA
ncbi:MAG: hypothetical protein ACREID_08130, partial [Planctomycetota bacterium]